jgi:cytoskeletal protein CcmA (bactofilin family)
MTAPARRESVVGEINTLLGRGSEFDGKLKGEVFSDDVLVVGEGAVVEAEVDIGEIIIQGTVIGNIRAKRGIEILAPGRVKGDITTPSLQIDKGVIFEGRSFMEGIAETKTGARPSAPHPAAVPTGVVSGTTGTAKQPAGPASGKLPPS